MVNGQSSLGAMVLGAGSDEDVCAARRGLSGLDRIRVRTRSHYGIRDRSPAARESQQAFHISRALADTQQAAGQYEPSADQRGCW